MKYLKTYSDYNEGFLSKGLATAGILGALSTSPVVAEPTFKQDTTSIYEKGEDINVYKASIGELYKIRKSSSVVDEDLSKLLDEIRLNLDSNDSDKLVELNNKLSAYVTSKGFKSNDIQDLPKVDSVKGLTLFEMMGWLGSIALAICGLPQALQSFKEKNSNGISWGFVLLWAFGELFALAYVYNRLDLPLLLNYATNILIVGIILYYKIYPKESNENAIN